MFGRHHFDFEFRGSHHARIFEKGDLKYVILDHLKDKPAHGYEIIRALEDSFHGFYSPSAGSVYPTLQLLEDMGYVKSAEQDGKKVYTITEDGKNFLKDHSDTIDKIKEHMRYCGGFDNREAFRDIVLGLRETGRSIAREARRMEPEKMTKIREIIGQACRDIEAVLKDRPKS